MIVSEPFTPPFEFEIKEAGVKDMFILILTQGKEEIELLLEKSQLRHLIQDIDHEIGIY